MHSPLLKIKAYYAWHVQLVQASLHGWMYKVADVHNAACCNYVNNKMVQVIWPESALCRW